MDKTIIATDQAPAAVGPYAQGVRCGETFGEPYPARSAFEVANLPKGGLVEIEAIAVA